jgi:uncharacterized phage protein (TIGR02220 family)
MGVVGEMAERRMFSSKIVCSDAFIEMPFSAQALYTQLVMEADDDGFLNRAKRIMGSIGATIDDLNLLIQKRYILDFPNGVVVIKHWRMNNQIRKDRYTPTQYQEEFNSLVIKPDGAYTEKAVDGLATTWQPNGNHLEPQYSIDKYRLVENREDNILSSSDEQDTSKSETYKTIITYLNEKAGTNYKPTSRKTQNCINARIEEGFTVEDFKTVIDKKCAEWLTTDFEQYLRPSTLFGTKFESYLNAPSKQKQQTETPEFLKKWSV